MSSVILPGSYDPVTLGHLAVIERAAREYDEVYVVAFVNPEKNYIFSPDERVAMLMLATDHLPNVLVSYSTRLVIDYMREHEIDKIVKGYRDDRDYQYELAQAEWNKIHGGYDTELWKCDPEYDDISSTVAREKMKNGDSLEGILPESVIEYIEKLDKYEEK